VVGVRREDKLNAQAQIGQARAALGAAIANRSYATIVAPFDGVVARRIADTGTMAGPGVPLLRMEGGDMRLEAVVPESALADIRAGTVIPVLIDALAGKKLLSRVVSISPQGDPLSHTFIIKARLPNDGDVRSGMFGRAQIRTGSDFSLRVPASALVDRDGLDYVYVIEGNVARLRLITTGSSLGDSVTVLSGLRLGDCIAASNIDKLTDNAPVVEVK
jgi:RND family efflux transporter MFP subunit